MMDVVKEKTTRDANGGWQRRERIFLGLASLPHAGPCQPEHLPTEPTLIRPRPRRFTGTETSPKRRCQSDVKSEVRPLKSNLELMREFLTKSCCPLPQRFTVCLICWLAFRFIITPLAGSFYLSPKRIRISTLL